MTKSSLHQDQRRTVEIIETLGFGVIKHLLIRAGLPCYETGPRIVQSIKLDSARVGNPDLYPDDLALKAEFQALFAQLNRLQDGTVDIEVRHGIPFRLVLERAHEELPW